MSSMTVNSPLRGSRNATAIITLLIVATGWSLPCRAADPQPVIDMHLHTLWWQPDMKEPLTGLIAPHTREELRNQTVREVTRWNVVRAVGSGADLAWYRPVLGKRLLPGLFVQGKPTVSVESIREMFHRGELAVLAEFAPQYAGLAPDTPTLEPYWAVAEELDLPVGIHMGLGPPGAAYHGQPEYRMQLSNPLLLENVLLKHSKLRVYVSHAGWPLGDEMVGLLYAHPQVYVDISVINWVLPRAEFHDYLRRLVNAGFDKRIMFGSDNMMWPESFGIAIGSIQSATFLTADQKRDILCRNAATFLRLEPTLCQ